MKSGPEVRCRKFNYGRVSFCLPLQSLQSEVLLLLLEQGHATEQFLLTIKCGALSSESSVQGHSGSIPSIMQQISMRDHLPVPSPILPTRGPNEMPGVWPRSRHVALVVGHVFVGYVAAAASGGGSASVSGRTCRQELSCWHALADIAEPTHPRLV